MHDSEKNPNSQKKNNKNKMCSAECQKIKTTIYLYWYLHNNFWKSTENKLFYFDVNYRCFNKMSTIIKFDIKELRKLASDKNSCVLEKKVTQNLALQPWCLGNLKESIKNLLDYKIGKFDKE